MRTVCRTFASEAEAARVIAALRAEGVPGSGIRMLHGDRRFDGRVEPVGGFAGPIAPDDRVGTFAGVTHPRWMAAGGFAGAPNRQRQGSFADTDRDVITSWNARGARQRSTGDGALQRLLEAAGHEPGAARQLIAGLHEGRVAVLAELEDTDTSVLAQLEQRRPATVPA